jgi:hypothetical protein
VAVKPIFGIDRIPEPWSAGRNTDRNKDGSMKNNPMLSYGPGPEGKRCKDCSHLTAYSYARTYHKCDLRRVSSSAVTDHRVNWPSCARFEEAT